MLQCERKIEQKRQSFLLIQGGKEHKTFWMTQYRSNCLGPSTRIMCQSQLQSSVLNGESGHGVSAKQMDEMGLPNIIKHL